MDGDMSMMKRDTKTEDCINKDAHFEQYISSSQGLAKVSLAVAPVKSHAVTRRCLAATSLAHLCNVLEGY